MRHFVKSFLLALATTFASIVPSVYAETAQPTVRELAVDCKSILVGTAMNSKCVLNERGMIVTKVQFKVRHSVTRPSSIGSVIEIVQLGGELDGKVLNISEHTRFEIGATYLLFLEDPSRVLIPATLGGVHGSMRIVRGDDGTMYPVLSGYRPVTGILGGKYNYARRAIELTQGVATLAPAEPSRAIPDLGTADNSITTAVDINTANAMTLDQVLATIYAMRGERARTVATMRDITMIPMFDSSGLTLCWCGYRDLNLVYEQMPTSWTPYDHNEWAMARFNNYFDVHRYTADDGTWNAPNSEDELCGWTSSSTLISIYGPGAGWGKSTLALNGGISGSGCDQISENDIHFNPAFSWAYDLDDVLGMDGPALYGPVLMHEMGHSHGFESGSCVESYTFDRPSIMIGAASWWIVDDGKGLHRRDAKVLRLNYSSQGTAESIDDMGVETWWMDGSIVNSKVEPTTVTSGQSITLTNLFVENMSTTTQSNVRIRVYLSLNTTISEHDIKLGSYNSFSTFLHDDDWRGNLTRTIPTSVASGVYYVGVIVTTDGSSYDWDDYSSNNATYFPRPITVVNDSSGPIGDLNPYQLFFNGAFSARHFVDTTAANADPDPPSCPGLGPMGPSIFLALLAEEDGQLEVSHEGSETPGFVGAPDIVAVYRVNLQGPPNTLVGVGCSTDTTPFHVPVLAGNQYIIRVGGTELGAIASWYRIAINPTRPFGSVPSLAIPWNSVQPLDNLNMSTATMTLPCAQSSMYGMWFTYTAPVNGTVYASTCDERTNFSNAVSIHSVGPNATVLGCATSAGVGGGCSNPLGASTSAQVTAGQMILVRVGSLTQLRGEFSLLLKFVPQNAGGGGCGQMQTVSTGIYPFSTVGANADIVPTCSGVSSGESAVWMRFVPGVTGKLIATTCADLGGSTRSAPQISIYQGTCTNLSPIACDNLGCQSAGARALVSAGTPCFIRVSGGSGPSLPGASASGKLAITLEPFCLGDFDQDAFIGAADLASVLNAWGATDSPADLNTDGIVDGSDLAIILDAWGPCF